MFSTGKKDNWDFLVLEDLGDLEDWEAWEVLGV